MVEWCVEIVDDLLPGPVFVVEAGVDDEANRPQHVILQVAVVAVGILIKPDFFAQSLRVERPAFGIGRIFFVLAEERQFGQFLRDGDLHVMSGHAFVVGGGLDIQQGALGEGAGVHHDVARPRSIGRAVHRRTRRTLLSRGIPPPAAPRASPWAAVRTFAGSRAYIWSSYLRYRSRICSRDCACSFGIGIDRGFEAVHVLVAELVHHRDHAGLDLLHLVEAELVDFFRRDRSVVVLCFYAERVPGGAVGESPGSGLRSGLWAHTHRGQTP
jgi:hypothetical protein